MSRTRIHQTRVIAVNRDDPEQDRLQQAARIVQEGGLVAFPTETVYGLGADAFNADAVTEVFIAKGRPAYDPVIVHVDKRVVSQPSLLDEVVESVSPTALLLLQTFWPGALTLVLPRSNRVPDVVTAGGSTVAVRCPRHPVAQALIHAAGRPIAAPSANRFSHTSPTTAQHVLDDLDGRVDLILDGGPTSIGVESTVLNLSGGHPKLLRPGGVSLEALEAVLGSIEQPDAPTKSHTPLASPGMLDRHYAPTATLLLFTGSDEMVREAINARAVGELTTGRKVGLLVADEDATMLSTLGCPLISVGPQDDADTIARHLFDAMRTLDDAGVELILARDFAPQGLGLAIRDRLRRAAEQIVQVER